jgi:signal transduction histidine kinase
LGGVGQRGTAHPRARATGLRGDPPAFARLDDLLASALTRLADDTGATSAAAWILAEDGGPVLAAGFGPTPPRAPTAAALSALFALGRATDLGEPGLDPALASHALDAGFAAGAPLLPGDEPLAAIFLGGGPQDAPGRVRPRTLAALAAATERLRAPAVAAAGIERLTRAADEMMRLTRLASLGDLLAEAVHEIRNPLVSVKTFLQLLPDNLDDPDFHTNFREAVVDEVRRMERLLDAILQHARPGRAAPAEEPRAALGSVLESVGRLLEKRAMQKRLRLVVDVGADLPAAAIDEDPLRQVVLNLCLNAFEATPENGCVRLTATHAVRISSTALAGAGALELTVDDEGPGVAEVERARLFEPFYSTRSERPVGLGLAVCRQLVDRARGSIHVEPAPGGGGARFCVRLPLARV